LKVFSAAAPALRDPRFDHNLIGQHQICRIGISAHSLAGGANMKTKIILIISVLSYSVITVFAQTSSDDFFPLAVGNTWTYNYYSLDIEILEESSVSDSGEASYKVVSQTIMTDSIVWFIKEIRNIKHNYGRTPLVGFFDTTYTINDSTIFSVIEYLQGNHRLVSMYSGWSSVFGFRDVFADSNALFRYYQLQASDTFSVSLYHYVFQPEETEVFTTTFKRHTGLTMVAYSDDVPGMMPYSRTAKTNHTLKSSFITSVESGKQSALPKDFVLHQNYPNPFNPNTTIYFDNPTNSKIKISIYDVLGRFIETILNDEIQPGKHSIQWNAVHYSSGVYFCVAQTSDQIKSIRLVLIK
jgi:hypothetical protein